MQQLILNDDFDVELTEFFNPENFTSKRKECKGDINQVVSIYSGDYLWQKGAHKFVITKPMSYTGLSHCYFVAYQGDGTALAKMGYEDYCKMPNCAMVIRESELDPARTNRQISAKEVLKYFCMIATSDVELRKEWHSIGKYHGVSRIVVNKFPLCIPEGRWLLTEGKACSPWFSLFTQGYFVDDYYLTLIDILHTSNEYTITYDAKNKTYQVLEEMKDGMLKLHPNDVQFEHVHRTLSDCAIRITNAGKFNIIILTENDIPSKSWLLKSDVELAWLNMFNSLDSISTFLDYHQAKR